MTIFTNSNLRCWRQISFTEGDSVQVILVDLEASFVCDRKQKSLLNTKYNEKDNW